MDQGGFGKVNAVVKKSAPDAGKWYAMKMLGKRVILERRMLEEVLRELALLREVRDHARPCNHTDPCMYARTPDPCCTPIERRPPKYKICSPA